MNKIILLICCLFCYTVGYAQVTTSSMSGLVSDENKEPLPGAVVMAVHEPSGTHYRTITNLQGNYQMQGMRIGGPYRIEISYVGHRRAVFTDIYLRLAENYSCNAMLSSSTELDEVVVIGMSSKFAGEKTGASTHITIEDINRLPTINRSLSDNKAITLCQWQWLWRTGSANE